MKHWTQLNHAEKFSSHAYICEIKEVAPKEEYNFGGEISMELDWKLGKLPVRAIVSQDFISVEIINAKNSVIGTIECELFDAMIGNGKVGTGTLRMKKCKVDEEIREAFNVDMVVFEEITKRTNKDPVTGKEFADDFLMFRIKPQAPEFAVKETLPTGMQFSRRKAK